jgi:hypothetical protein
MKVAINEICACCFSAEIFSRKTFFYFILHRNLQIEVCRKLQIIILKHEIVK